MLTTVSNLIYEKMLNHTFDMKFEVCIMYPFESNLHLKYLSFFLKLTQIILIDLYQTSLQQYKFVKKSINCY